MKEYLSIYSKYDVCKILIASWCRTPMELNKGMGSRILLEIHPVELSYLHIDHLSACQMIMSILSHLDEVCV